MDKYLKFNKNEIRKMSNEHFIKAFSVALCQKEFRDIKSVNMAVNSGVITLAQVKSIYSEDFVLAYIEMWLYNLNDYFNFSRKFNPVQISETAYYLYSDYYFLNLSEINLIMARIKKGQMGNLYQSIDGAIVYSYFDQYAKERDAFTKQQERFNVEDKISMNEQAAFILGIFKNSTYGSKLIQKHKSKRKN